MEQLVTVATMQGVLELQCGYESWASERALGDEYLCIRRDGHGQSWCCLIRASVVCCRCNGELRYWSNCDLVEAYAVYSERSTARAVSNALPLFPYRKGSHGFQHPPKD